MEKQKGIYVVSPEDRIARMTERIEKLEAENRDLKWELGAMERMAKRYASIFKWDDLARDSFYGMAEAIQEIRNRF